VRAPGVSIGGRPTAGMSLALSIDIDGDPAVVPAQYARPVSVRRCQVLGELGSLKFGVRIGALNPRQAGLKFNIFEDNQFQDFQVAGVYLASTSGHSKANRIERCSFVQSTASTDADGIRTASGSYPGHIRSKHDRLFLLAPRPKD